MKHLLLSTTICSLLFIALGCGDEATKDPIAIDPVGSGSALLSMQIGDIKTRLDVFQADPNEKEISSLACFVQTYGVGDPNAPEYKPGAFCKYFSTEPVKSNIGMEGELTMKSEGLYDVLVRIHSEGFNKEKGSDILFIANYQNSDDSSLDLTNELKALEDWAALEAMVTKTISESPAVPLLMYGKTLVHLEEGQVHAATIEMKRMAARFDVHYVEQVDPGNTKKFELTSIQVISPKSHSYLQPRDETDVDQIPTIDFFPEIKPDAATPDEIENIYVYPASNRNSTTPTQLRIKGIYRGQLPVDKTIDFKQDDGTTIPIVNNTRYLIQLYPPGDNKELSWDFKVEDWSDGETIEVGPTQNPLEIKEITFTPDLSSHWTESERQFDMTGVAANGKMNFTVEGTSPTNFDVVCRYNKDGSSIGLSDIADLQTIVTQSAVNEEIDPDTKKKTFTQDYSIDIPSQDGREQVPVEVVVYIHDAANFNNVDSVVFTSLPDYNGINNLKPVKLAGQFWAPVNIGATSIVPADNQSFMGFVFQWGRNGYKSETVNDGVEQNDMITGPVSNTQATTTFVNNFIASPEGRDWLIPEDPNLKERNLLWSKNVNDSPCPEGWRLPRVDEYNKIVNANPAGSYDAAGRQFTITGDDQVSQLIFPLSGWRTKQGVSQKRGSEAGYWTSSTSTENNAGRFYVESSGATSTGYGPYAEGLSIRCIQE